MIIILKYIENIREDIFLSMSEGVGCQIFYLFPPKAAVKLDKLTKNHFSILEINQRHQQTEKYECMKNYGFWDIIA